MTPQEEWLSLLSVLYSSKDDYLMQNYIPYYYRNKLDHFLYITYRYENVELIAH